MNIQQIRDIKWIGNHHSDREHFKMVADLLVDDSVSIDDKFEAIKIELENGMGMSIDDDWNQQKFTKEQYVMYYVNEEKDYRNSKQK